MAFDDRQAQVERSNLAACPMVESIDIIGETWRLNVVNALREASGEELRFNELKRATNARSRTLSQSLETLMEHDLVDRRMEEASPVAVYYSLTEKGRALDPVFDELERWADEWLEGDWSPGLR